jgi:hypothetical protein
MNGDNTRGAGIVEAPPPRGSLSSRLKLAGETPLDRRFTKGNRVAYYSIEVSRILTENLKRFATFNSHHLAGQVANLDFWLKEVMHCLDVLDGYKKRFEQLKEAQTRYAVEHRTVQFSLDDAPSPDDSGFYTYAEPPVKIRDTELKEVRRALRDAAYRFLIRSYNAGLIAESTLRESVAAIGTSVEARDFKRRRTSAGNQL